MTRYLATGAICGFGLAVLLLAVLGDKGTHDAVAAVSAPALLDAGRPATSVSLQRLPTLRLPGNGFNPARDRLINPQLIPIGMRPLHAADAGQ
ncbi:MAG: hypothetical protein K1X64_16060 [Myxococcaceae bacterium]|nr:hypothetical protein [Myxococcaceae bacterium]